MKKKHLILGTLGMLVIAGPVNAAALTDLVGTWAWEGFTIDVTECGDTVCANVAAGPSNVGKEMFLTPLQPKDDGWDAEVMHPASGETYFSHLTVAGDVWKMEGCTASGVCAKGDFIRQ